ncbi:MAG: putative baseplate assembly protein [Bacteroidota bacterium]
MNDSLSTCGCTTGIERHTPMSIENRPGLSALAYRVGTHGRFNASMQAAITEQPGLAALTTRDSSDPTLALVDAWSMVLDVLSFYQERIANEHYLRTATERFSVLQLARRIGYELSPGVAASTTLAFTLQTGPGVPDAARIPIGTQAQSVPGQDEVPQTYETIEEITARPEWQAMRPQSRVPVPIRRGTQEIWLKGVGLNLRPGDGILLVGSEREADSGSERWDFRPVREVHLDRARVLTRVVFERALGSVRPPVLPSNDPTVYVLRQRAALFGANAPDWRAMPESVQAGYKTGTRTNGDPILPTKPWNGKLTIPGVLALDGGAFTEGTVFLDALYPEIVPGSWVVLAHPGYSEVYRVEDVFEDARTGFTLASKTTRLRLDGEDLHLRFGDRLRETVVYAVSDALERAEAPLTTPVEGATVTLADSVTELSPGQLLAISGTDLDTGETVAEVATLDRMQRVGGRMRLTFARPLSHRYAREDDRDREVIGARLNANVARATHGKAVAHEVLGSGDGSVSFQSFALKNAPLTYTASGTASGAASSLVVRVGNVRWDEVPSLYEQPADARVYVTRLADDGTVTVQFGDGIHGARLPTGSENVTASYRHSIGMEGLVNAGQVRLLMTRPLGVKDALNPEAPRDAAAPERLEDARRNAPLTVLTLDRIVSVQDVEDFARAYAGIGKAKASVLWSGEREIVHLTITGMQGAVVSPDSDLFSGLRASLDAARHVHAEIVVAPHEAISFGLEATVAVDPAFLSGDVLVAVEAALAEAFAFEARDFAQGVSTAEVLATMQAVGGVVYVDLRSLGGQDPFANPWLVSNPARQLGPSTSAASVGTADIQRAQLLTIDPAHIVLSAIAP